jgi:D-3-phosphoglycerate dehydrogenase
MSKAQGLVTAMQLSDQARKILRDADLDMVFIPEPATEDEFVTALKEANPVAVLMRGNPPLTRRALQAAPLLKIIAKHGAGIDSVDLPAAASTTSPASSAPTSRHG